MPTDRRRAAARRRAWGRGPMILRFEPLEGRALLSTTTTTATPDPTSATTATAPLPDLVGSSFKVVPDLANATTMDWGDSFHADGVVANQGQGAATSPFQVDVYASPTPSMGQGSVLLGQVTVPAGLAAGGNSSFSQDFTLPPSPISAVGTSGSLYIGMLIDPGNQVPESNETNNSGVGIGSDLALVTIQADPSASLVGTSLTVSPGTTDWGGTFTVTQQVANVGTAAAPATRALVTLMPSGGGTPAGVGFLNIPPVPVGQTVTATNTVTLPSVAPSLLVGTSGYTLSVVQDADYVLDQIYPHAATQGLGADEAQITVTNSDGSTPTAASTTLPDFAVTNVTTPTPNLAWGQSFQVNATVQNAGSADAGTYRVRFLLVGTGGSVNGAVFLGDLLLNGLQAGYSQAVTQTLTLPSKIPGGQTLNSLDQGRIAVVVDPENAIDELSKTNNEGVSNVVTLKVVGADGTVTPVTPVAATGTTAPPTTTATSPTGTLTPAARLAARQAAREQLQAARAQAAAKRAAAKAAGIKPKAPPNQHSLEHNLKVIPKDIGDFFKRAFKT